MNMKRKVIQFFLLIGIFVFLLAAVHYMRFGGFTGFAVFSENNLVNESENVFLNLEIPEKEVMVFEDEIIEVADFVFSDVDLISLKIGESKLISLEVLNEEEIFMNNCGLVFLGETRSWFDNSQTKGFSSGEKFRYDIEINVPENVLPGNYDAEVLVKCDGGVAKTIFNVGVFRNSIEAEIVDYEKEGNVLKVYYLLKDYSGADHEVSLDYSLIDLNGITRLEGKEFVVLGRDDSNENVLVLDLPKNSFGEFDFELIVSDGISEINVSSEMFLPLNSGLTGLSVSGESKKQLSLFGMVLFSVIILFFAGWFVRKVYLKGIKKNQIGGFENRKNNLINVEMVGENS